VKTAGLKPKTLRYRAPFTDGPPMVGTILMGEGERVRRGYRILGVKRSKTTKPALGVTTWRLAVESMPKAVAISEIKAGAPYWSIVWDRRERKRP
jgi:hypothetical protein